MGHHYYWKDKDGRPSDERRGVIKINLSVWAKKLNYITINEINFAKDFDTMHHLSQIIRVVILQQPFSHHIYNIYTF